MLFWLSFCDPGKPKGQAFLGVSIVDAIDSGAAIQTAWDLECNPGGEALICELPDEMATLVPDEYKSRLLSRVQCDHVQSLFDHSMH